MRRSRQTEIEDTKKERKDCVITYREEVFAAPFMTENARGYNRANQDIRSRVLMTLGLEVVPRPREDRQHASIMTIYT